MPRRSRHPKSPRMFYLVKRAGKIVCVWCGNFKGSDSLLLCLSNPHEGYTDQQWDTMATILQRYFKAE
ncbi:hypothetical protein ACQ9LF_11670 [Anaerohalosphaeraceae bacterium U12dextr]